MNSFNPDNEQATPIVCRIKREKRWKGKPLFIVSNDASYQHYFDSDAKAQQERVVEINERTGPDNRLVSIGSHLIRKNIQWMGLPTIADDRRSRQIDCKSQWCQAATPAGGVVMATVVWLRKNDGI